MKIHVLPWFKNRNPNSRWASVLVHLLGSKLVGNGKTLGYTVFPLGCLTLNSPSTNVLPPSVLFI